eukprot:GFUD01131483.1.p1 GENE.GFUD01131483.1~~GFUD01131483.1.p1  ORF type:complete len:137 (+),score=22.10 GFUD01131483.1:62-412(+)
MRCAVHARRVTIMPRDMNLAKRIRPPFPFLSCPSVQTLAMGLFISSSPSSYIFFIIFIRPALGSDLSSNSSAFFFLLSSWYLQQPSQQRLCDSSHVQGCVWQWTPAGKNILLSSRP